MRAKPSYTEKDLEQLAKKDLVTLARRNRIPGISKLTKSGLIARLIKQSEEQTALKAGTGELQELKPSVPGAAKEIPRSGEQTVAVESKTITSKSKPGKPPKSRQPKVVATPPVESPAVSPEISPPPDDGTGERKLGEEGLKIEPLEPEETPRELPGDDELPESYGRDYLFLIARDHEWLYAYWELSGYLLEQLAPYASKGMLALILNILEKTGKKVVHKIPIGLQTTDWFFNVAGDGRIYEAELGILHDDTYTKILASHPATTPRASVVAAESVQFITIPVKMPLRTVMESLAPFHDDPQQVLRKLHELQKGGITVPFEEKAPQDLKPEIQVKVIKTLTGSDFPLGGPKPSEEQSPSSADLHLRAKNVNKTE